MASVQIDESVLAQYQQLEGVFKAMLTNPKARAMVLRAQKEVAPNASIPEIDAAEAVAKPLEEKFAAITEQQAALQKAWEEDKAQREADKKLSEFKAGWDAQKVQLRRDGYMDGAIEAIEKIAHDKGIPDLQIAAAVYDKQTPPVDPVQPTGFGSWNFFDGPDGKAEDEFLKTLMDTRGDSEGALRKQVNNVLRDARGATQRAA